MLLRKEIAYYFKDAITGPIKLPSDIELSEELIVWSESKLVFPKSDNFLMACLAKTRSKILVSQLPKTLFRECSDLAVLVSAG